MTRGLVFVTLFGCAPQFDGEWTGQCLTTDDELRVRVVVPDVEDQDAGVPVQAILHLAERPAEALYLDCDTLLVESFDVEIDGCFGFWSSSGDLPGPFDFSVDGVVAHDEPTDSVTGRCTFEGGEGPLDLVRTP